MKVTVSSQPLERLRSPLLMVPILEGDNPLPFQNKAMKGEFKKLYLSYDGHKGCEKVLFVGLGKKSDLDRERVRRAFGIAVKAVRDLKIESFSALLKLPRLSLQEAANSMLEGIMLGSYSFDKYKTKPDKKIESVTIINDRNISVRDTEIICNNVNFVRDLVNENSDVMVPERMASVARDIAKKGKLKITVLGKGQLKRLGLNLLLAVSSGSRYSPQLIILEYKGSPKKEKFAIVGKGITFDSGGLNLKPAGYIETMRQDMAGAATVFGIIKTVAELKLPINLIAVAPVCENMIGPRAYKPGDVFKSYSGKTVEIGNTDAEGRLILADALAYTEKNLKPGLIIDIATLTGAAYIIFGEHVTAMIGSGDKYKKRLFEAGEKTRERVWELPLYDEYMEELKGDIADVSNLGYNQGKFAGTIMGGAFLKSFVQKVPLIHLDVGNTAYRDRPPKEGYIPKNATGIGVRLLVEFFRSL